MLHFLCRCLCSRDYCPKPSRNSVTRDELHALQILARRKELEEDEETVIHNYYQRNASEGHYDTSNSNISV